MPTARRVIRNARPAAEPETEAPSTRRRRGSAPEPEPATNRRRGRRPAEDDDDESDDGTVTIASGWGGYKQAKETTPSKFDRPWNPDKEDDDEYLIKFLENVPFAAFKTHWVEWAPKGTAKSYVCLEDNCPLDDVDTTITAKTRFNVMVNLCVREPDPDDPEDDGDWKWIHKFMEFGITLTDILIGYDKGKLGPLDNEDLYFAYGKTGRGKQRKTNIRPVKARDVVDPKDWNVALPTEKEYEEAEKKMLDSSSLFINRRSQLQELADMVAK